MKRSISVTTYSEPRIYNAKDNGGIPEEHDYLESRELKFSISLHALIENDENNY